MNLNAVDRCLDCMQDKAGAQVCPQCGRDEEETPRAPPYLPYGTRLNDQYVVGGVLGHGGFGITYLAWDTRLDTRVALKEYLPRDLGTRGADGLSVSCFAGEAEEMFAYGRRKFLEEAQKLARFSDHPGIVSVLTYFEGQGTAYMVMQYVEGTDLKQHLARAGGHLPVATAMDIMTPVLDALRAVHAAGLLHRDMSPDNIYITSGGRIIILDFGAAKDAVGGHSQSQALIRKPGYSPEEQYRSGGDQGPWTDVYAAAATLYRMLTGEMPPEALDRLADDGLQPPSQLGVAMNQQQEAALMKSLAVRAPQRYQSIEDFQNALVVPDEGPENDRKKDPDNRSNAGKLGLFLLLAVVLGGLGWVAVYQGKDEQEIARLRYEKELAQIEADREKAKREAAEMKASQLKLEQAYREAEKRAQQAEQTHQQVEATAARKEAEKRAQRAEQARQQALRELDAVTRERERQERKERLAEQRRREAEQAHRATEERAQQAAAARCTGGYLNGAQIRALMTGRTAYGVYGSAPPPGRAGRNTRGRTAPPTSRKTERATFPVSGRSAAILPAGVMGHARNTNANASGRTVIVRSGITKNRIRGSGQARFIDGCKATRPDRERPSNSMPLS